MNNFNGIIQNIEKYQGEEIETECTFAQYTDESIFLVANLDADAEQSFSNGMAIKLIVNDKLLEDLSEKVARGSLASSYEIVERCQVKGSVRGFELRPSYIKLPSNTGGSYEYRDKT